MEKIKKLLGEMASPELAKSIVESLEEYRTNLKAQYDEELKNRLLEAKRVCVTEMDNEKAALARKIEVFLESKLATIEKIAQKQMAIGEGKALKTLKEAKAVLDGVAFEDANITDTQAMLKELQALRLSIRQVTESKEKAELKASRANQIAMKLLDRAKLLESKQEPKKERVKVVTESKKLNDLRKEAQHPVTTRTPIVETITKPTPTAPTGDPEMAQIASTMDEVPAY